MKQIADIINELKLRCETAKRDAALRMDVVETEALQLLELALRIEPLNSPDPLALRDIAALLERLDEQRHPWARRLEQSLAAIYRPAQLERGLSHDVEVARRVLSAHVFLEGSALALDFGDARGTPEGDLLVGLGLRSSNASLQHFLTALARQSGYSSPVLALRPYFDSEAEALAEAIEQGHAALSAFLRSILVYHWAPGQRGLRATLPERWQARFRKLSSRVEARRLQLEFFAGEQLVYARHTANELGLNSLRGLALAFDTQPLLRQLPREQSPRVERSSSEQERLLSFADRILRRIQGPLAREWDERVRGLLNGAGPIGTRSYDESRFLGPRADRQPWRFSTDASLEEEPDGDLPSRIPVPGRDYLLRAGDRLSTIAFQAYQGKADYRYLLRHNPHLRSPSALEPGMRINIPIWPPKLELKPSIQKASRVELDGQLLRIDERPVGPWPGRSTEELEAFASRLSNIDTSAFVRARCSHSPDAWLVSIDGQVLGQIDDRDLEQARSLFPDAEEPLELWSRHVAAQLRGDLILAPDRSLAFGHRPLEPQRARWFKSALQRALRDGELQQAKLRVPSSAAHVDLLTSAGEALLRLEAEDLDAMRQRPERRLGEMGLAALPTAIALARLWLADALGLGGELPVWPMNEVRRFALREEGQQLHVLAPVGQSVFAIMRGRVVYCGLTGSAGLAALVEHEGGLYSRYTHLASLSVRVNQRLTADRVLGRVGMSGEVTEPVLGFAVERRAEASDEWRVDDAEPLDFRALLGNVWGVSSSTAFELYDEDEELESES